MIAARRGASDDADTGKPKPRRSKPAQAAPTASTSASASAPKRKAVRFDDDDAPESVGARAVKKAKVSSNDNDLLSRSEAAELIGKVAMELEGMRNALERTREALADFTGRANGKQRVALKSSS